MRRPTLNLVLGLLVMTAMGLAQLLGIGRGFWCECAPVPKLVDQSACVSSVCHPETAHLDGCTDEVGAQADHSPHEGTVPRGHEHRHQQVREALKTRAVSAVVLVPEPGTCEVAASLLVWGEARMSGCDARCERERIPVGDGGPPTPVLVARCVVMLV